jgi:membrane associated rhomboid family serine protease
MGLYDRQYMQAETDRPVEPRSFAFPWAGSITWWLIFLNTLVYVLDRFLANRDYGPGLRVIVSIGDTHLRLLPIEGLGHFSAYLAVQHLQVWRFLTFQFLHANFDHLLFNMISLFFFGPIVERYLTSRQFLVFYLLCGMGGAVMYFVLLAFGFRISDVYVPLVGASAGIFGVLVAATRIAPDAIGLVFGILPVRLRTLVWIFIAYAVIQVLFRGSNAGGEAAHLGGAMVGYLLMSVPSVAERIAWLGKRAPPF